MIINVHFYANSSGVCNKYLVVNIVIYSLLFNIFLYDFFFIMNETDFASYEDDNTPYVVGSNIDVVINLENASLTLFPMVL